MQQNTAWINKTVDGKSKTPSIIKQAGRGMIKLKIKQKQMENESILIWKMAVASAISWEIAKLAGSNHPYLAPLSVILCLQTTVNRSIQFSYHRMVGTVI